jgi:hypothetical protein
MATPTHFTISTSQSVSIYEPAEGDEPGGNTWGEDCTLSISYALDPGDNLPTVIAEKAEEITGLHLLAHRTIRLTRAECKGGRQPIPSRNLPADPPNFSANKSESDDKKSPPPPPEPEANRVPPITGPQRMAIEEHFRRLNYDAAEIEGLLSARFGRRRLTELNARQASALLQELRRLTNQTPSPTFEHPTRPTTSGNGHSPSRARRGG